MKIKVGIIGAGHIGAVLASKLSALGHDVAIANSRGPASLAEVVARTGARAVTVEEAVQAVGLVVVTIPQKSVPQLPRDLFRDVPSDVVVVDTGNYYPAMRDGIIEAIEAGETESGWVAGQLGRPVLKAFNNIMVHSLEVGARPRGAKDRIALPVAGDDARGKDLVLALLDALGFDGVDGGSLADSWRQQPGTPAYCTDLDVAGVGRALAEADRALAPSRRDLVIAQLSQRPSATPAETIALVREIQRAPV